MDAARQALWDALMGGDRDRVGYSEFNAAVDAYAHKLVELLREMDAVQSKTDEDGGSEIAWYYYRERIEDAMGLTRGALDTYPSGTDPEVVAYRSQDGRILRCLRHFPEGGKLYPVTSEELPDGGICTHRDCGVDVLIDPEVTT